MQEIGIDSTLVEEIKNGNKYIEARLGKPRFLKIAEGDILSIREDLWLNGKIIDSFSDSIKIRVTQVLYFETFNEMLNAVDYKAAVPGAKSIKQALEKYEEFYSSEDEARFGVVALFFELLK